MYIFVGSFLDNTTIATGTKLQQAAAMNCHKGVDILTETGKLSIDLNTGAMVKERTTYVSTITEITRNHDNA